MYVSRDGALRLACRLLMPPLFFLAADDTVQTRQKGSEFSPADSRSLELMFCSHLLLPNTPS